MATNQDIYRNFTEDKFTDTKRDKEANSMRIKEKEDFTIIEGYGHAMYSLKVGNTIVIFEGWRGASRTTSKHLTQLKREAKKTIGAKVVTSQKQPKSRKSDLTDIFDAEELEEIVPDEMLSQMTAEAL